VSARLAKEADGRQSRAQLQLFGFREISFASMDNICRSQLDCINNDSTTSRMDDFDVKNPTAALAMCQFVAVSNSKI